MKKLDLDCSTDGDRIIAGADAAWLETLAAIHTHPLRNC